MKAPFTFYFTINCTKVSWLY